MMEFKGRFKEYSKDWMNGTGTLSFTVLNIGTDYLQTIIDKDLRITVREWRDKRSLTANAYYWVLIGKIADVLKISKPFCHNMMLRRYGQTELFDGQIAYTMLPDSDHVQKTMDEMEEAHFAPTSQTTQGKQGVMYRAWKLLKPSHTLNTKEMSVLIDGVVSEAKELGIETLPPYELQRIKEQWGVKVS